MDIIHELEIETTPEKLFEALSTDKGISAWWTKAKTQAKVGGINEFAFSNGAVATFRVEKLEPGKAVAWSADQVPPDWNGTQVLFELSSGKKGGPVTLRFGHTDDELRMMFSCCHPRLHEDVQVALVLHMLSALGVDEIASAFLVSPAAIEKRLSRGKKTLAESKRLFELTAEDFAPRLSAVHRALYLLFSEGYHGPSSEAVVRIDLCREAMRLVRLRVDHAPSATPATYALAALMWLDAARLPGRIGEDGNLRALFAQDRSRWNWDLIA